jgi:hypothetical protein
LYKLLEPHDTSTLKSPKSKKVEYKGIHKSSKTKDKLSKKDTGEEGDLYKTGTTKLPDVCLTQRAKNSSE